MPIRIEALIAALVAVDQCRELVLFSKGSYPLMPIHSRRSADQGSHQTLASEVWARLELLLEAFEDAWLRGERPALEDYLSQAEPTERPALLRELVHEDLEYRLKAGEAVRVETYLERYPELHEDPETVTGLIAAL